MADRALSLRRRRTTAAEVLSGLGADVEQGRKRDASRRLKNAVIGSRAQKEVYLEGAAVARLCAVLSSSEEDPEVVRHVAAALGSLAYVGPAHAAAVCCRACVEALARWFDAKDARVLAACMQSLKILYQRGSPPVDALVAGRPGAIARLVQLLPVPGVSGSATSLLAA